MKINKGTKGMTQRERDEMIMAFINLYPDGVTKADIKRAVGCSYPTAHEFIKFYKGKKIQVRDVGCYKIIYPIKKKLKIYRRKIDSGPKI